MRVMNAFEEATSKADRLAFGIDLGTTNSAISVVGNGGKPEIVQVDGKITMPSCVMWNGSNTFVVGEEAYNKRDRQNVCYSVKRLMGSDEKVTLKHGGVSKDFEPWEISCEILKALVNKAKKGMYKDISDVVITVPAYFSNRQIEDTLKAGEGAGLNVLSIMKEPTAACLVYNQQNVSGQNKKVLLYDLGGGTFDISVVLISNAGDTGLDSIYGLDSIESTTLFSVLKVAGDMRLGGDDVDHCIYDYVVGRLKSQGINKGDISQSNKEGLLLRIEMAKKSGVGRYYDEMKMNGKVAKVTIEPSDFINAFTTVYRKTKILMNRVLSDSIVGSIDQIITVGGSTKSEVIQACLKQDFPGVHINASLNPDESVALGAAIQAKRLKHGDESINILDCLAMDIGVSCEGYVEPLLKAGMQIPCQITKVFVTDQLGQDVVDLDIFQGNSRYFDECEYLGRLVVEGARIEEDKRSKVLVKLSIDTNGLLVVESQAGKSGLVKAELMNVLGSKPTADNISDKRVVRWRSFAARLSQSDGETLLALIASFVKGEVADTVITDFISKHKSTHSIETKYRVDHGVEGE